MTPPTMTREPDRIVQGASLAWLIYDGDFLADDGWVQKWVIVRAGSQQVVVASDNGDSGHLFTVSASTSDLWTPGAYKWRRLATDGTEVYERASGDLVIEPSFLSAAGGIDARTDWEQIHDDLIAAYKEFVASNGARTQFSVAGRTTTYSTAEEFMKAIDLAKLEMDRERKSRSRRAGKSSGNSIQTRMS